MHAWKIGSSKHLCVWDLVFPFYSKKFPRAGSMEVFQLLGMTSISRLRLKAIEQSGEHYCFEDLDLCLRGDASSVAHIHVESAEGSK